MQGSPSSPIAVPLTHLQHIPNRPAVPLAANSSPPLTHAFPCLPAPYCDQRLQLPAAYLPACLPLTLISRAFSSLNSSSCAASSLGFHSSASLRA